MTDQYTLYGGDISYYTGKALAYLRYKGISFDYQQATRDVYKSIIVPAVGWPVIPVVVAPDGAVLQDTSDIIDALEQRFPDAPVMPQTPRQNVVSLLLEVYGDEWLKLPAMHYRWNHNEEWIVGEFGRLSAPHLDEAGQREVGERTCKPFRGSLPMLGVTEHTAAAVETSYEAVLRELDAHFAEHDFVLGSKPCIGDYGLIGPLYAHQYRDPNSGALMKRIAPNVAAWVERVMNPQPATGEFLPDDAVPDTLLPVLRRMFSEQVPVVHDTMRLLGEWAEQNPTEHEIPRGIGMHEFVLLAGQPGEVTGQRVVQPFVQWMWQRPLDAFAALDVQSQNDVRALLARAGGEHVFDHAPALRVQRKNYTLVRA